MLWKRKAANAAIELDMKVVSPILRESRSNVLDLATEKKRLSVKRTKELLFGLELEFVYCNHLHILLPLLEKGILKEDRSCPDGGEYVTLPYGFDDLVEFVIEKALYFDLLLEQNKLSITTGMHVHLTKSAISPRELCNLIYLLNHEKNREILSTLAGRDLRQSNYARFLPMTSHMDRCYWTGDYARFLELVCPSRAVVNKHNTIYIGHRDTIEIRVFISPSCAEGVLNNLLVIRHLLSLAERDVIFISL